MKYESKSLVLLAKNTLVYVMYPNQYTCTNISPKYLIYMNYVNLDFYKAANLIRGTSHYLVFTIISSNFADTAG